MKITTQLRDIHRDATEKYERLSGEVRDLLKIKVEEKDWFFLSRLKSLESFALKVETGRVHDPRVMEDFYGCTIVVPTVSDIEQAELLVLSLYDLDNRRPQDDAKTHKASSGFDFDDLRLYVTRPVRVSGKGADLEGILFEVQIKTILQHAWSVATHDLIYKSDTISWPTERIAFQVKAMLEHAEVAIAEANRLSDSRSVAKKDRKTENILRIIEQIARIWPDDRLPHDVKRLAETIWNLIRACDLSTDQFTGIIEAEKRRVGLLPVDLSPYAFFVQALAQSNDFDFQEKFMRPRVRARIVIHNGMDLPAWMQSNHNRIINLDNSA